MMERVVAVRQVSLEELFVKDFDPYNRGKSCIKLIKHIKDNKVFSEEEAIKVSIVAEKNKPLIPNNQAKLLEYSDFLIRQMKREEITHYTFYKNLSISWRFCQFIEKSVDDLTKENCNNWFEYELERYENKQSSYETLKKNFVNVQKFFRWCFSVKKKYPLELFSELELPKRRTKERLDPSEIPNQDEVKKLVECIYVEGKRFSVRNQAIVFLANAIGGRISELLSIRNKDVVAEENYIRIYLPQSKTSPRTVIVHKSDYLDNWGKLSPNKDKREDAFFFCQANGDCCTYASIRKQLNLALQKSGIPWPKGKGIHFLRALFSTRAKEWPYNLKNYWMGWSTNGNIESHYTMVSYNDCISHYFKMLEEEQNPFFIPIRSFWENTMDTLLIERLMKKDEFRRMINDLAQELGR